MIRKLQWVQRRWELAFDVPPDKLLEAPHDDRSCTVMCVNERTFTRAPGESVLLPCPCPRSQQEINPKKVTWSKDQTPVSNDTESYRGRVWTFDQTPSRNFSLLLSDLTEEDSGDYTCTADDHTPYVTLRIKVPSEGLWWLSLKPVLSSTGPSTIASYVGVALLLIGGSALIIYKLRTRRTQVGLSLGWCWVVILTHWIRLDIPGPTLTSQELGRSRFRSNQVKAMKGLEHALSKLH
ncbi:hypothetical protein NFI96_000506, partial [Prochilodus magdalenae]